MLRGLQTIMNSLTTPVTLVIDASNLGQSTQFDPNIMSIRLNEALGSPDLTYTDLDVWTLQPAKLRHNNLSSRLFY